MSSLRAFISSVQKELELERAAVASLMTTDPFLLQHCEPVLFEKEPPAARPAWQGYLATLHGCALYVLIIANEYGPLDGNLSATHHEYREAQKLKLPTVVFVKGPKDETRSPEMQALVAEIRKDGYKYVRFHDREDLKPKMLDALRRALAEEFSLKATPSEVTESQQLIDAASTFESTVLADLPGTQLDANLLTAFSRRAAPSRDSTGKESSIEAMHSRGLLVRDPRRGTYHVTAAAWLLFGTRPADRFPQCEILVEAHDQTRRGSHPKGLATVNAPLPHALDEVLKFVDAHTFHPRRIVGLNNLRLDEYPTAALREALVNAVAHRSYEDRSRKVFVRVFSDRVEIESPGYPPQPLTLAKLRKGGYRPCSRNPMIAQTLATLGVMEQRGSGFARMQEAMLNHGLAAPEITQQDGFFTVTLRGPAGDYEKLKVPANAPSPITPAIEAQLNERQKRILKHVLSGIAVTRGWCVAEFDVANDTAGRDLKGLTELKLIEVQGKGRAVRYVVKSTDNRPTNS